MFRKKRRKLGKKWGGADYFGDVGSQLLPEVPPAAPTREMAAPGGAGTPQATRTAWPGPCGNTLSRAAAGTSPRAAPRKGEGEQQGAGRALRVGWEAQSCASVAQHLCGVLSLPPSPGQGACCCPPCAKPFPPACHTAQVCGRRQGCFTASRPAASAHQPGAEALSALSLCVALRVPQPRPSFLLPRGGLRATLAAADGSCPCCHLPSLSQLLGLRCNEFVRSAQQTPGGTSVVASGDLGTPQTHPALMLRRFPPPWPCPQLRACGERPRDSQWSCRAGISARPGQRAEVVAGTAATTDLSPGKGSHSAGPALRAHGHTQLYSRAKQKKAAILFAEGVINKQLIKQKMVKPSGEKLGGSFTRNQFYLLNFNNQGGRFLSSAKSCFTPWKKTGASVLPGALLAASGWFCMGTAQRQGGTATAAASCSAGRSSAFPPVLSFSLEPGWGGWSTPMIPARQGKRSRENCSSKSLLLPWPETVGCGRTLCPP